MSNITSLKIGKNKIQCMLEPNITDYVVLPSTFVKKTIGPDEFYCYEYTAAEDCFVRFEGKLTNSENQFYLFDLTPDLNNITKQIPLHSRHMQGIDIGWYFFDVLYLMRKDQTFQWRVRGFIDSKIVKFSVK